MFWTKAHRIAGVALAFAVLMAPANPPVFAQQGAPVQTPAPAPEAPADQNTQAEPAAIAPIDVPERPVIILRGKSKWDDGFKSITDAFVTLRTEAEKAKLAVNGKPLAVFVQSDDDGFTFEAMLPLEKAAPAGSTFAGGVSAGKSPGGQALKFEHRGAYEDIESTYEAIAAYLDEKGLSARDELIEEFINETIGSDDTNLAVDIYVLLK